MGDLVAVEEKIDKILDSHDKGIRGFDQTLLNLKSVLEPLDGSKRESGLNYLFRRLVKQTRQRAASDAASLDKQRKSIGILFRTLIDLGRMDTTLCEILGFIDLDNVVVVSNWMNCVFPELTSAVYLYAEKLNPGTLDALKEHIALYSHPGTDFARVMPTFSNNITQLSRAIDNAEFSRFEQQLRSTSTITAPKVPDEQSELAVLDPGIIEALKEANEYLWSGGTFDPKKAADLLRSSIDETHREIVKKLERRISHPYAGGDSDGKRREYFRVVGFISEPEEKFVSSIYKLLSEEASHKLIAPRETVLVMEQTVRSYLLLLIRRLSTFGPSVPGVGT
jgi:hypothetical protein